MEGYVTDRQEATNRGIRYRVKARENTIAFQKVRFNF